MEVRAHLRHLRTAPRKVRLVVDLVRGLPADRAIEQLSILPKQAALPVMKLIKSAMANADHNFHLDPTTLKVKSIVANEGPRLKRYRPRAFGRAAEILKRSTHITVVLEGQALKKSKAASAPAKPVPVAKQDVSGAPSKPTVPPTPTKPSTSTPKEQSHQAADANVRRKGTS